jgi:beta-phosphoglucomutase-like phosphatase (HAD superfamily)
VTIEGRLVIFDCDGVLVDTEPLAVAVRARVLAEAGWTMGPDEIVERFLGRSRDYVVGEVAARLGEEAARAAEDTFGRECEAAFAAQLTPVPGIAAALAAITEADGIDTCVASSGGHDKMRLTLGLTGLWSQFSGRVFSAEDVAHGKPAPDLFLHAAASMGYPPDRCVVIEDSPAGVAGALAAGMKVVGYAGGVTPRSDLAGTGVVVIDDMAVLPATLARLL